jgi:hypothetical protein
MLLKSGIYSVRQLGYKKRRASFITVRALRPLPRSFDLPTEVRLAYTAVAESLQFQLLSLVVICHDALSLDCLAACVAGNRKLPP